MLWEQTAMEYPVYTAGGKMVFSREMNAFIDTALAQLGAQPDVTDNRDAPDMVNCPPHYTQGGIECIDAIEAALTPEEFRGFCKGNSLKYIWRERHKSGDESLQKAQWYLARLAALASKS